MYSIVHNNYTDIGKPHYSFTDFFDKNTKIHNVPNIFSTHLLNVVRLLIHLQFTCYTCH